MKKLRFLKANVAVDLPHPRLPSHVEGLQITGIWHRCGFFRELQPRTSNLIPERKGDDHCKSAAPGSCSSLQWCPANMLWSPLPSSVSTLPFITWNVSSGPFALAFEGCNTVWGDRKESLLLPKTWKVEYDLLLSCLVQLRAPQMERVGRMGEQCSLCFQGLQQLKHSLMWPVLEVKTWEPPLPSSFLCLSPRLHINFI